MEATADVRPSATLLLFNDMTPLTEGQLRQLKPHFEAVLQAEEGSFEIQGATPVVQIVQIGNSFKFGFSGVTSETLANIASVFNTNIAKHWIVNQTPQGFPLGIALHHQVLQVRADESRSTLDVRFAKFGPHVGFEVFMNRLNKGSEERA